ELQYRVSFAVDSTESALRGLALLDWKIQRLADPDALAEGRLEPLNGDRFSDDWQQLVRDLRESRSNAAQSMNAFRERIESIPLDDRQNAFASLNRNARRSLQSLANPVEAQYLIGASDSERQALTGELPLTGLESPQEPTESVAGIQFQSPAGWSFNNGVLELEPNTAIRSIPVGGNIEIAGEGVILPDLTVLREGTLRLSGGEATLNDNARVEVGGVPITASEDGARVRGSNASFIAGPHAYLDLPEVDLTGTPIGIPGAEPVDGSDTPIATTDLERRVVRFTATETTLPDGTEIRRGTGRLVVMFDGDEAVGVLEGTTAIDPGSHLYTRASNGTEVELVDRSGARGTLDTGAVVYRDGALVGVQSESTATLDGLRLSVNLDDRLAMTPYRYDGENRYVLGAGTRVFGVPEGVAQLSGEDVDLSLDGIATRIISGGVLTTDGVVTQVLPNSVVETRYGVIRTEDAMVTLAVDPELTNSSDNAVFMDPDMVIARGEGFTVAGSGAPEGFLPGGADSVYVSREARFELRLDGGSAAIERHPGIANRPAGIRAFNIDGSIEIASGPQRWSSRAPTRSTTDQLGVGGDLVWIEHNGEVHEIDPRPVHSTLDPATDVGQFRTLAPLMSERFENADRAVADRILAGDVTLRAGDDQAPQLMHAVQQSLAYYLDRIITDTRQMDADTVDAITVFQRFSNLDPTGELNAETLQALDDIAPPLSQPSVERIQSGPFAGELSNHVEGILSGIADPMRYRQGFPNPKGPLVRQIQRLVGASPADGIMGPGTTGRIEAWQRANGAPVTGAIDAGTLRRMLDVTGSTVQRTIQPRPKLMVMLAMNNEVPDEFRRFRELAASRGATPVIIGPWDEELQNGQEFARYLAQAESGAIDMDWLVISGHSTGRSTWGQLGRFEYSWFNDWRDRFPRAFSQVEKLTLLNCYNVTPERARNYWPSVFPNIQAAAGFMYSAPGVKSQTSDEFMLNS
ncbi:MAG: peptidoglycan-binding domain-containing protein, partial [Myxococcota bacterium]